MRGLLCHCCVQVACIDGIAASAYLNNDAVRTAIHGKSWVSTYTYSYSAVSTCGYSYLAAHILERIIHTPFTVIICG